MMVWQSQIETPPLTPACPADVRLVTVPQILVKARSRSSWRDR
jgi:hypothetical protein